MKKMNKKGFTLIEMLVVIAIIAVLVSIIVPAVGNSTTKAKAATDAANLRSVIAEAQINILSDDSFTLPAVDASGNPTSVAVAASYYTDVECATNSGWDLAVTVDSTGKVTAKFGTTGTLEYFQNAAG
jgi:prepilin-type N-terminal cleavage/methylation domain-containing protein